MVDVQSVDDFLLGSGVPAFSFGKIGDKVTGTITAQEITQQTDFDTDELLFTKQGKPLNQLVVTLDTNLRDWEGTSPDSNCRERDASEDDGKRKVYVKSGGRDALAKAVRKSGNRGIKVGGKLSVELVDQVKIEGSKYKKKVFLDVYTAPELSVEEEELENEVHAAEKKSEPKKETAATPENLSPEAKAALEKLGLL
jgi:hypothetical protein